MSLLRARAALASLFLAVFFSAPFSAREACAQAPRYTVTDIGPFEPRGINDVGQAAGRAFFDGRMSAALYDGTLKAINPPGASSAEAWAVNNRGRVVGTASFCDIVNGNCVNGRSRAFVYHRGAFTVLGTLGGRDSFGTDISEGGHAVGYSYTTDPITANTQSFASDGGPLDNLGAKMGVGGSLASAANAVGQITGFVNDRSGFRGFLYDTRDGTFSLFRLSGFIRGLNDLGQIVGSLDGNHDGSGRAFLYAGGALKDLGTLFPSHTYSTAWAVNNAGQIVGLSSASWLTRQDEHAFLYEGDRMLDLNALIRPNSGWVLHEARDINAHGQIVGRGTLNGQARGFMLTPVEPLLPVEPGTDRAVALDSVTFLRDPLAPTTTHNFSADGRTRLVLIVRNVETFAGENVPPPAVRAEDAQGQPHALTVEHVGKVPRFPALAQIVARLPDALTAGGEYKLTVSFRGHTSNKATVRINPPPAGGAR